MVKIQANPTAPVAKPAAAPAPAPAAKAAAGAKKKRSDFATWADFCEFKKQRCLAAAAKQTEKAQQWEAKKAGEHVDKAAKKVKRIEKLKAMLAALQAEVEATK